MEAARFIGQRMIKEGGDEPDSRLRYGFRLVTGALAQVRRSSRFCSTISSIIATIFQPMRRELLTT